ncbi:bifunctional glutamate N-acetyltransferase/amino-acid acetyltransferase ArgJ [Brevibacterium sp. 5221]|uniref:Arginine biosynthesis bifunctional protein ArgJ n=1 Tax=Brevibacterium rongguiense TaxID=2695267 RepID=A0A6N9H6S0_9MICO|nr:bifunctional glutamate N-acetyltransferase/amino-acid acetyltransferase ArgJ [Brevibacterium rongguiense]MYM19456.1 bifunctional glutamate N-acetyltransferase/amino-acid acetyltransferase ArgJ [Brevibacterium rongguiense]
MSTTYPRGFTAAAATAGLKPSGTPDLALVVNTGRSDAIAAVYTANRCKANPVLWSERATADGRARAVVLNSGGANCYTGAFGFQTSHQTAEETAELVGTSAQDVVVCSTGLIGVGGEDFRAKILAALPGLAADLAGTPTAGQAAARAIMTTDTVPKTVALDGPGFRIGGMAKGAGMLAPALATMLVVLTTDAPLSAAQLDAALRAATATTFDRLDTDGCMSTNDTVVLLSSGEGAEGDGAAVDEAAFARALADACADLAGQLHRDAEGAHHDIAIEVAGAATEEDAVAVARAIARSNLFKAAIFGEDPNWGRVVAQVGTTDAQFDPQNIDVAINGVQVCLGSAPHADPAEVVFARRVDVRVDLHTGGAAATILTSDLTHDYVEENSAYAT